VAAGERAKEPPLPPCLLVRVVKPGPNAGNIVATETELCVTFAPLSSPHRTAELALLCEPLRNVSACPGTDGLYRIRGDAASILLHIDQGAVGARLSTHLAKTRMPAHSQGDIFGAQGRLECSYVLSNGWTDVQRLELETDLIAAVR
jgi:hypothetical protein